MTDATRTSPQSASRKTKILVLCGGQSAEHDVSLASGKSIVDALDPSRYEIFAVAIDPQGVMRWIQDLADLRRTTLDQPIDVRQFATRVSLVRGAEGPELISINSDGGGGRSISSLDVAFPILHGPYGEDGTVQGYLKFIGLPFVGPSVLASAVGMDKDVTKRLLQQAGIRIGKFVTLWKHEPVSHHFGSLTKELGTPFFLKPVNMGSSIGVFKIKDEMSFKSALAEAFQFDNKVICEEFIDGREIECAVIGNQKTEASPPGEIIPQHEFYSYEAKYLDAEGARLELPAKLNTEISDQVRQVALKVYRTLNCEGLSRVDFFLRKKDSVLFVNEINTMPGFTKISMYPKMMELAGRSYSGLVDELVQLAIRRRDEESRLKTGR
jgi:D-alanine-D-alanine ligase